ncbi:MAG: bacterial transcriptional activator domain-containing protein [Chloroflexota bacterium]
MIPSMVQQLAQQLRDVPPAKRIILIHPNFKAQHLAFIDILESAIYVRFEGKNLTEAQLEPQLDTALKAQSAKLSGKMRWIILDEADRISAPALKGLLLRLLGESKGGRILVLSHILPEGLLDDETIGLQATFIPNDPKLMLWDYAQRGSDILLEVRAFGEGRVHLKGRLVDTWDGALPRALFFYLIDRGMVTRAEIFQTFWPNLSTREATNVFHVTKRKISEVLGTELTVYGSSFYHISPRIQLSYDVSLFNQHVQDSENTENAADALRRAIWLYRGDFLTSLKADWVVNRRESLQQAGCDALITLGKACEASGNPQEALGYYLRASRLKPEREDSTHAVMRLYRDLDMRDDAKKAYRRLVTTLRDRLHVSPSPQVEQLAAQIGP